jgi:hypothetical protein
MLVKAADIILASNGMHGALWSFQRVEDLLAGRWTSETADLFIKTPNR